MELLEAISALAAGMGFVSKAEGKRRPMKIQSLIFSKDHFKSADDAKSWASKHNFKATGVDETGNSYRLRQESPGKFKKMRTIELTSGVKAVVGKCMPVAKSAPTRGDVHVPTAGADYPAEHKHPVHLSKDGAISPGKTAGELHDSITEEHQAVGGTIRTGSGAGSEDPTIGSSGAGTERFVFGPMTFDIDRARKIMQKRSNSSAKVSPDWSHKINIDTKAAMKSTSTNPVMIAQIPTTNGLEKLLIDGHHRMYKAMHDGVDALPAYTFTPDETLAIMDTNPNLMEKMKANLSKTKPMVSTANPGDGKPVAGKDRPPGGDGVGKDLPPETMATARQGVNEKTPEQLDVETAEVWAARAIAAFEKGDQTQAELHAHEALEHASGAHDDGKTVARLEQELITAGVIKKAVKKDTNENQGQQVTDMGQPSSGGGGDNALAGLYNMQSIVEGMDWELEHNTTDPDLAKEMALSNLQDDPQHYRKLEMMRDGTDWSSVMSVHDGEGECAKGLRIDVGSGPEREKGYIGLDLVKHDHGTVIHDVHMGLPFPDGSAKSVILRHSLEHMDELSKDPKPLLSEIQRILMPGGQFVYEGPNQIQNQPEWLKETWSEKFQNKTKGNQIGKIEGNPTYRQEFARIAVPDAATSNDSEPRIGIAQYDMLPADALLAMDAMGYYWSDATSSGRGNRLHGYASQGALVKAIEKAAVEASVDGITPSSGNKTEPGLVSIFKSDKKKQVVYGVVLAPDEVDLQEDWMPPEEIEKTAHFFMRNGRTIGANHETKTACIPVESYIAPMDMHFAGGQYGDQVVKKGSWVLGVFVPDPDEWKKVESGEYTGFSVGGWGQRSETSGPKERTG